MREMNIRSIDLNLLVALRALLEEKHVTRAAEKIGLSQPAMSRALSRLRKLLNDPLLVKGAGGFILTARAIELAIPLQAVFNEINHIISPPSTEPSKMQGEISIATRDNEMVTILPEVVKRVSLEAPGMALRVTPLVGDDLSLLDRQEVDFVMCGTESNIGSLYRQLLYKEDFVCLVSAKNPVVKKGLTLENFVALKHCVVSITGFGPGFVDTVLAKQGLKRDVSVRVPLFLATAPIIAESDLIVTLPRRLGILLAQNKNIVMLEPPLAMPSFSIYLYWHARNQNNPLHKWLRKLIAATIK